MKDGECPAGQPRFIVDHNVGKLARRLRMMGYDCLFFTGDNDSDMIRQALADVR
ncbi:MAG: Mut7-C RNAse domain-containing protein [Dehalococcoidales bacterium]|nr:Mut7-C RNAse domain-containing protein [Dehalococcoidales bacterium]